MDARKELSSSISGQVEVAVTFGNWSFETSFSHLMEGQTTCKETISLLQWNIYSHGRVCLLV